MTEKLSLRNFGPIKAADIEIGDLTVFVGPQASGKSLAAQILYFFRRLEYLFEPGDLTVSDTKVIYEELLATLEWWFGNDLSVYASPGTTLSWQHPNFVQGRCQSIFVNDGAVEADEVTLERISNITGKGGEAEIYIPSGRALYGFLPPYKFASRFLDTKEWPGYILNFYETLGRSIRWLNNNPASNVASTEMDFLRLHIEQILKGDIQYGPDTIALKLGNKTLSPTTMAGGQMEIWPFWAIVEAGIRSDRLRLARIYFDEPEAHLHPSAQRSVVEMIAYLVNRQTQFVLATHSPYVLYALNVLLQASEVQAAGGQLPATVPTEAIISPEQVRAYRFTADGSVHSIKDTTTGLIDEEELDRVADDLGATFTELLENLE